MEIKKGKFNVFDVLLILLVCAVIAVAVFFFLPKKQANTETVTVEFTYKTTRTTDMIDYNNLLTAGDAVYNSATKEEIGKLVSLEVKPSPIWGYNHDLEASPDPVLSEYPECHDLYLTIRSEAKKENLKYAVGETSLTGKTMWLGLRTQKLALEGTVLEIHEVTDVAD